MAEKAAGRYSGHSHKDIRNQSSTSTTVSLPTRVYRFICTWYALFTHLVLCICLSSFMVFTLDGYAALGDDTQSRLQSNGQFILRVSDITTFISVVLVFIRIMTSAWIGTLLWNYVFALLENDGLKLRTFSRIMNWKILPPTGCKTKGLGVLVVLTLICILPQNLISPLLTGSVNWNIGSDVGDPVQVASGVPFALNSEWYWYLKQDFSRRQYVYRAAGLAGLAWSNLDTQDAGTNSVLGRTCRRVIEYHEQLPENSTLYNATIPCIEIDGITWPDKPLTNASGAFYKRIIKDYSAQFSITGEEPFSYYQSGVGILFDPTDFKWDSQKYMSGNMTAYFPPNSLFSGTMTAVMFIERHPETGCNPIRSNTTGGPSVFGPDSDRLTKNVFGFFDIDQFCFAHAVVNITAGVITAPSANYISARVVDASSDAASQPMQPSPWVSEAMFLMPDTMTKIALMNTSSMPTWNNLDGYTTALIRQAYLANWDMLHATFEQNDTAIMTATPQLARQVASVSSGRVLAWLGISFLLTITGMLVVIVESRYCGHGIICDGPTAALLTDAKDVVQLYPELAQLNTLTDDEEGIKVYLNHMTDETGLRTFKLGFFNENLGEC